MFRCKNCSKRFSANLPEQCPDCGAQQKRKARGALAVIVLDTAATVLLVVLVMLIGYVVYRFVL